MTDRELMQEMLKVLAVVDEELDQSGYNPSGPTRKEISQTIEQIRTRLTQPDSEPVASVLAEVAKATKKFPTWPTDPLHAVAVLGEEFGELTKAVLQCTYEPHKSNAQDVRTEAIQTAAMALRFLMSLDTYEYKEGEQHEQN